MAFFNSLLDIVRSHGREAFHFDTAYACCAIGDLAQAWLRALNGITLQLD